MNWQRPLLNPVRSSYLGDLTYATPHRKSLSSVSSWTKTIRAGTKILCAPGEYGTATSIVVASRYRFRLLKRSPPRDMSSQTAMSSSKPERRMHALKFTLVRACLRLFSGGRAGLGAGAGSVGAGLGDTVGS